MVRHCAYCKKELYVKDETHDDFSGRSEVTYVCKNQAANVFDYEQKKLNVQKCPMLDVETKYHEF